LVARLSVVARARDHLPANKPERAELDGSSASPIFLVHALVDELADAQLAGTRAETRRRPVREDSPV